MTTITNEFVDIVLPKLKSVPFIEIYHALAFDWLIPMENGKILHAVKVYNFSSYHYHTSVQSLKSSTPLIFLTVEIRI